MFGIVSSRSFNNVANMRLFAYSTRYILSIGSEPSCACLPLSITYRYWCRLSFLKWSILSTGYGRPSCVHVSAAMRYGL